MKTKLIEDIGKILPKYIVDQNRNLILQNIDNHISKLTLEYDQQVEDLIIFKNETSLISNIDEELLERLLNFNDDSVGYKFSEKFKKNRVYIRNVIIKLKMIYNGNCQICGCNYFEIYGVDITEAHHIDYFGKSLNNNINNIIILCPNHHALIHKTNPVYDREKNIFNFSSGIELGLSLNYHL